MPDIRGNAIHIISGRRARP